jgi:hypothetical protein
MLACSRIGTVVHRHSHVGCTSITTVETLRKETKDLLANSMFSCQVPTIVGLRDFEKIHTDLSVNVIVLVIKILVLEVCTPSAGIGSAAF